MAAIAPLVHQPRRETAVISLRRVGKTFGRGPHANLALDDISLEVRRGEFLCVVGASGCGKSTLLSLIAGLDEPTVGRIDVAAPNPAVVFQDPALFPWLSAQKNIELALRLRGVARRERAPAARRLLSLVHLNGFGRRLPHELSGGMRQRVAIARSLAQDSGILLMDEPFAALDAITRDVLHDEITRIWSETGIAIVFVTHNVREAIRLGDRVVLLTSRPGRIAAEFPVDIPRPRRIESHEVGSLSIEITDQLRKEIRRHVRA